jgi:dinuclear metal center YbgI/SA1388 family protein
MLLTEIMAVLEELAPLRYAENWDNVGLLVGDPSVDVRRVLVTVDYTAAVAEEAAAAGATLVVAYHPPMFAAVKRVPHEALWADAVRRGVALYSPHTALDVARQGTNDVLADACGMHGSERRPIRPYVSKSSASAARSEPEGIGLGRIGRVGALSRTELIARLKTELLLGYVMVSGPTAGGAGEVAVAAGAGGELLQDAMRAGAEVFVTGEIRHHDALLAAARGVMVVATLHSNSERRAVRGYAERIAERLPNVTVSTSTCDADPLRVM